MTDRKLSPDETAYRRRLTDAVLATRSAYNAAWRAEPTAKGYPAVDKALAKLNDAEGALRTFDELARTRYAIPADVRGVTEPV